MSSSYELLCKERKSCALKTVICVVTHNRLEYTKACLESISRNTDRSKAIVVVVDNASTDGTVDWLRGCEGLFDHALFNKMNKYPGAACNQAWMHAINIVGYENVSHL